MTEIWDLVQAFTPVEVGVAEAFVGEVVGFALVAEVDGLGVADVGVALGVLEDEVDGEACGVPLPPRPVSSQRTPRTRASRTTITTARRNQ